MAKIIVLLTFFSIAILHAQNIKYEKIDFKNIEQAISDSTSSFYYPKLLNRYQNGDTTLSISECRYLYYGYTFQKSYNPYWKSKQIDELLKIYKKDSLSVSDCDTIIKYASMSIDEFPFDLRQLNTISYAYHLKNDKDSSFKYSVMKNVILDAIFSSGDGTTCESGLTVINVSHEYEILKS